MHTNETYNVSEFCEAHHISRTFFYQLLKDGRGPTVARVGAKRLITRESAESWRRKIDAESETVR